jgi:Zn-dependent protease with chaperone function
MHLSYKARYYNGHSSKPFLADVSIHQQGIDIIYINDNDEQQTIKWTKENIKEIDFSSAIVVLRYGSTFPYQQLDVTDRAFITEYKSVFRVGLVKEWLHFSTGKVLGLLALGFLASIALGYFFALPFIADKVAQNFPVQYEISMGKTMYEKILEDSEIDTAKTEAINHFFDNLNIESKYPITITVVKDSTVNAFAMPGGGIIVYDAILDKMKSPEELAALLSHEYSHVELKHATRNVFRSLSAYLFISLVFSDANGIVALVVDNANQLRNLSYSRELEHEADANGLLILKQNKLNTSGMIHLFEQLKKQQQIEVNELISTHPDLDNRIDFVGQFTEENIFEPEPNDSLQYYFDQLKTNPKW